MPLLADSELNDYLPEAANMTADDRKKYLNRANSYALGVIGGIPLYTDKHPAETVKTAVALAYEIFAEGQEAQTNPVNGNITEAAPVGFYARKANSPFEVVDKMLQPYAEIFKGNEAESGQSDKGIMWL
ncbi:hypothetical protein [Metabacillus fastidiosus]|uniref:hypothetical protein n=1 Tax=Metabacillus fastidiosus TaxID=1458 RepID=UPI003D284D8A